MPIRRVGGSGHGGGHGGSVELASAYVTIMPETSKLAPGVRAASQRAGRELDREISGAMQTAFKRSETYAQGFGAAAANSNLGVLRSMNAIKDSATQLGTSYENLNKVLSNKKSTLGEVRSATNDFDRVLRNHGTNVEALGVKLAKSNKDQKDYLTSLTREEERAAQEQQRIYDKNSRAAAAYHKAQDNFTKSSKNRVNSFFESQARDEERAAQAQQRTYDKNLRAAESFHKAQQNFTKASKARVEKHLEDQAHAQNKAFDKEAFHKSAAGQAQAFKRGQQQLRSELEQTAEHGASSWRRMSAQMALAHSASANSLRSSMRGAIDEVSMDMGRISKGASSGILRSFGAPMAIAGAGTVGLAGGAVMSHGLDRVLTGGMDRIQTIQNAQVSMQAIMKDPAASQALVDRTVEMAQGTPYGADTFLNMARNMVTMGVKTEQIVPAVEALANSAALMGKPASALDQLSREFGKIKAEGRLMGRDVYELQRVGGINAREIVANSLGITGEELTKKMGKKGGLTVDADTIIQTLIQGIMGGSTGVAGTTPAYGGGLQIMRNTLSGSMAVMKSQLDRVGAALLGGADPKHPSGFLAAMPHMMDQITRGPNGLAALSAPGGPLDQFQKKLSGTGAGHLLVSAFEKLPGLLASTLGGIGKVMDALHSPAAQSFFHIIGHDLSEIWQTTKSLLPNLMQIGGAIAKGFAGAGMAGLSLFSTALNTLAPVLRVVTGLLAENKVVVEGMVALWGALAIKSKAAEIGTSALSRVMGAFTKTTMDTKTGIVTHETMWNRMGTAFRGASGEAGRLGGTLKGSLAAGMSAAKDAGRGLLGLFGGPWGLAITAATVGLSYLAQKHEEARAKADAQRQAEKDLQGQLDEETGNITDAARKSVVTKLQDAGALGKAKDLHLDPQQVMLAATGDAGALSSLRDQAEKAAASGSSLTGTWRELMAVVEQQANTFFTATQRQREFNAALNGTWALTDKGIDYFKRLGIAVTEIPSKKTLEVFVPTEEGKKNLEGLKEKGFEVEAVLGNPDHFRIRANSDDALAVLADLLRRIDVANPRVKLGLDPSGFITQYNNLMTLMLGKQPKWGGPGPGPSPGDVLITPDNVGGLLGGPSPSSPAPGALPDPVLPPNVNMPPAPPHQPQQFPWVPHRAAGGRFAQGGLMLAHGDKIHSDLFKTPKETFSRGGWLMSEVIGSGRTHEGPGPGSKLDPSIPGDWGPNIHWGPNGAPGEDPTWLTPFPWPGWPNQPFHPGDPYNRNRRGVRGFKGGGWMTGNVSTDDSGEPGQWTRVGDEKDIPPWWHPHGRIPIDNAWMTDPSIIPPPWVFPWNPAHGGHGPMMGYSHGARMIQGAGTGTSDSILGYLNGNRPIFVSHGESINTAAATSRNWPVIEAMNRGASLPLQALRRMRIPGFAGGDSGAGLAGETGSSGNPQFGGIPGLPSGAGEDIVGWLNAVLAQYNAAYGTALTVTADYPGGPHGHKDDGGQHSARHAVDISGNPAEMATFAKWWTGQPELLAATRQLIHSNPNFPEGMNVIGGRFTSGNATYGAGTMGEHTDHVHLAVQSVPGQDPNQMMGSGQGQRNTPSHIRGIESQLRTAQTQLQNSEHDIDIAKQHIEDLKHHKKPPPQAEVDRAQETLRRAEERHSQAEQRVQQLSGELQAAQSSPAAGRGHGSGSGSGDGHDLGKTFVDGIMQSFGFDGSVFSDPRQWAGVKSIMALVNWFTKPVDSNSMAGMAGRDQGIYGKQGMNAFTQLPAAAGMFGGRESIIDQIVQAGMAHGASNSMLQSALMAGGLESSFNPKASNSGHDGIFQMDAAKGTLEQRRDPAFAANWWFQTAAGIPGAENMDPAALAALVERPGPGVSYAGQAKNAKDLLAAALARQGQGSGAGAAPQGGGIQADESGYNFYNAGGGGGGGGGGALGSVLNLIPGIADFRNGGRYAPHNPSPPALQTYEQAPEPAYSGAAGGEPFAGSFGNTAAGPYDMGQGSGGGQGGVARSVGNVTFNLGPGASLGWDPKTTTGKMQQYTDMATRQYQDRTVMC